jgi:hypothetical protein
MGWRTLEDNLTGREIFDPKKNSKKGFWKISVFLKEISVV